MHPQEICSVSKVHKSLTEGTSIQPSVGILKQSRFFTLGGRALPIQKEPFTKLVQRYIPDFLLLSLNI
jgi:hypothetical protein